MLQVKAKTHRDLVTVVGSLASVSAGEWLTAEGRWVQDREFGLQFKAEMLTSNDLYGISKRNRRPFCVRFLPHVGVFTCGFG